MCSGDTKKNDYDIIFAIDLSSNHATSPEDTFLYTKKWLIDIILYNININLNRIGFIIYTDTVRGVTIPTSWDWKDDDIYNFIMSIEYNGSPYRDVNTMLTTVNDTFNIHSNPNRHKKLIIITHDNPCTISSCPSPLDEWDKYLPCSDIRTIVIGIGSQINMTNYKGIVQRDIDGMHLSTDSELHSKATGELFPVLCPDLFTDVPTMDNTLCTDSPTRSPTTPSPSANPTHSPITTMKPSMAPTLKPTLPTTATPTARPTPIDKGMFMQCNASRFSD